MLGLAAYVRAVALPLAALAAPHFRARGAAFGHVVTRTLAACLIAALLLLPWGIRNKLRYGEFFLTDSHGGHTALVGSNPNSDGNYSRSLNRLFAEGTGYRLFAPPHRESDRAAFKLAVQWAKTEPKYALGLLASKADKLLSQERQLLYWPVYRQSVLPPGSRVLAWFTGHWTGVERVVDAFWYGFVAAVLIGVIAAFARRNRPATSLLPIPLALAAIYVLFFAEARYHLPVAVLLMPFAGAGVVWVGEAARDFARFTIDRQRRPRLLTEGLLAAAAIAACSWAGPGWWPPGRGCASSTAGRSRPATSAAHGRCAGSRRHPAGEPSPVRGTWDGFGLRLTPPATTAAAATDVDLPAGKYHVSLRLECGETCPDGAEVAVNAGGSELRRMPWPAPGSTVALTVPVTHGGGKLHFEIRIDGKFVNPQGT